MRTYVYLLMLAGLLSSCKVKEVIRYVEVPKISVKIDSIYINKSDSVVMYQKGDTVFKEKYKTIFKDRFRYKTDSIAVPFEVIVEKPIEKIIEKKTYVKGIFWWIGVVASIIAVTLILNKIFNPFAKIKI